MSEQHLWAVPPRKQTFRERLTSTWGVYATIVGMLTAGGFLTAYGIRLRNVEAKAADLASSADLGFEARVNLGSKMAAVEDDVRDLKRSDEYQNRLLFEIARDSGLRVPEPPTPAPEPTP